MDIFFGMLEVLTIPDDQGSPSKHGMLVKPLKRIFSNLPEILGNDTFFMNKTATKTLCLYLTEYGQVVFTNRSVMEKLLED